MRKEDITSLLEGRYEDINPVFTYGEDSYFYNPKKLLPRGVYFVTIKELDGQNDKGSNLNRENVYRLSFAPTKKSYERLFGLKPKRPPKGGVVNTEHDFTALHILTPHPIYAWMGWVQILSPKTEQLPLILELLDGRYEIVKKEFSKKMVRRCSEDIK